LHPKDDGLGPFMKIKNSYRLGSYRITEYETGGLWWETHFDFGKQRSGEFFLKGNILTILIFFTLFFILPFLLPVWAAEKEIILEESGIHYPGGFDPNTVGEVQGKAFNFSRQGEGPVGFQLISDRKTYTILTSPPWYWKEIQAKISEGTEVIVRGSKSFGKDGNLYIVAQEIRIPSSGQHFVFRGKEGTPLWKRSEWTGRGSPGSLDPSSGGRGGFGAGGGSKGHGRR
jgi:hypothetical protein